MQKGAGFLADRRLGGGEQRRRAAGFVGGPLACVGGRLAAPWAPWLLRPGSRAARQEGSAGGPPRGHRGRLGSEAGNPNATQKLQHVDQPVRGMRAAP